MRGIKTQYKGPTEHSGSRIVASFDGSFLVHPYDHGLNPEENHKAAALKFAKQSKWLGRILSGWLKPGTYLHIFQPKVK
jgi:hypothetical protein